MNKILRIKEVTSRVGLSKSYIYALAKEGKFPKSIRLIKGGAAVGWLESSVNDWIDECVANQGEA